MSRRRATKVQPADANVQPAAADPQLKKLPAVATWLRQMADLADEGKLAGLAAVAMDAGGYAATNIADPTGPGRLTLAGYTAQLTHMLQASEHNDRMASLAARIDPGPTA
jgi:hypothetical protein